MQKEQSFIDDISSINLMYLMFAKEFAKNHPVEAIWVLGITEEEVSQISKMTPLQISEMSKCGRILMRIKIPDVHNTMVGMGELSILREIDNEKQTA